MFSSSSSRYPPTPLWRNSVGRLTSSQERTSARKASSSAVKLKSMPRNLALFGSKEGYGRERDMRQVRSPSPELVCDVPQLWCHRRRSERCVTAQEPAGGGDAGDCPRPGSHLSRSLRPRRGLHGRNRADAVLRL